MDLKKLKKENRELKEKIKQLESELYDQRHPLETMERNAKKNGHKIVYHE